MVSTKLLEFQFLRVGALLCPAVVRGKKMQSTLYCSGRSRACAGCVAPLRGLLLLFLLSEVVEAASLGNVTTTQTTAALPPSFLEVSKSVPNLLHPSPTSSLRDSGSEKSDDSEPNISPREVCGVCDGTGLLQGKLCPLCDGQCDCEKDSSEEDDDCHDCEDAFECVLEAFTDQARRDAAVHCHDHKLDLGMELTSSSCSCDRRICSGGVHRESIHEQWGRSRGIGGTG